MNKLIATNLSESALGSSVIFDYRSGFLTVMRGDKLYHLDDQEAVNLYNFLDKLFSDAGSAQDQPPQKPQP